MHSVKCITRKIWRGIKPPNKKSANIKSFLYFAHAKAIAHAKQIGGCGLCTNSVPGITRSNHFYRVPILQGLFSISLLVQDNLSPMVGVQSPNTMMPPYAALHTICSIDDLARHSPQRSLKRACACGRFGAWLDRTQSANIFVSMVEANPPNLIPAKISGYTVYFRLLPHAPLHYAATGDMIQCFI